MPRNLVAIIITFLCLPGFLLLDVIRKGSGDIKELVPCDKGTIVANDDATHSIYCAKSLKEAGCDLRFSRSTNVGYIPSNATKNQRILKVTSPTGQICNFNEQPLLGPLYIQDYPRNIFKSVWTNVTGVQKVNETLKYIQVSNAKIEVETVSVWPGILLKLYIHCMDNQGRLRSSGSSRRCILVKYEGHVNYPLTSKTFYSVDPNTKVTTTITKPHVGASRSEGNVILIYAILVAAASFVVILSICVTVFMICGNRAKRKRHRAAENGNIQNTQEDHHNVRQVIPTTPKKTNKHKNTTDKVLVISPVINTDSRTLTGLNTFNIEPSGSQQTADIYMGEEEEEEEEEEENNETRAQANMQKESKRKKNKLKTVSFAKSKSESRLRTKSRLKGVDNVNFDGQEFKATSSTKFNGKFKKDSSRKRPSAFGIDVDFTDAVEISSPTNRHHTGSEPIIRQSPRQGKELANEEPYTVSTRRRPTYAEGQHPENFVEDVDATSESIEAMFSFSNDMIENDDEYRVVMEGEVELGCVPTDFEENTTNVFPEDEEQELSDNGESFNEHFNLNKRKENSLYSVHFLNRQNEGDMLMF